MSRREFHFISGASSKFWAIESHGDSFTVTFGKIGTAGTSQTKAFADAAAAGKAYDKLVLEKTSKGYVEMGGGSPDGTAGPTADGEGSPAGDGLSELWFATTQNTEDIGQLKTFIGQRIVDYRPDKSIKPGNAVYRIRLSYDDESEDAEDFHGRLASFLDSAAAPATRGLVIGNWSLEGPENAQPIVDTLVAGKDRMPNLVALFFGDIGQEESEISWIENCDMSPLLAAFPKLELFRVRGATGLAFGDAGHPSLRALAVESGGLDREVVKQICRGDFPCLEYLELWLGTDGYGGNTQVSDLTPLFKGTAFPRLKYLGLRNTDIADDIAGVIVSSPVASQLEVIDLSLGTLSDEGAKALLKLPQDGRLKRLDLHRNFLGAAMVKQLKTLPFILNLGEQEAEDEDMGGRFVAIGE